MRWHIMLSIEVVAKSSAFGYRTLYLCLACFLFLDLSNEEGLTFKLQLSTARLHISPSVVYCSVKRRVATAFRFSGTITKSLFAQIFLIETLDWHSTSAFPVVSSQHQWHFAEYGTHLSP